MYSYYYITDLHYLVLLALGARSVIEILIGFWMRLVSLIKEYRGDHDWSVVGTEDKGEGNDRSEQKVLCDDWRTLARTVADIKVKDLFHCLTSVCGEYGDSLWDRFLRLCAFLKVAFWPWLTMMYLASVRQVYQSHFSVSPCRRQEMQFMEVAKAYETLTDDAVALSHWRKHSYYVNAPDFLFRYFAIHLACCVGWCLFVKRVHCQHGIKDCRSFFAALGKDWWLSFLLLWSLLSSILTCFMLYQAWIETKSPFKTLGISPTATPMEIKKACRRLSLMYHPDNSMCATG